MKALAAAAAAIASGLVWRAMAAAPPGGAERWRRTNHRGEPISLLEGPAAALGTAAGIVAAPGLPRRVRAAGVLACVGAGSIGLLDDLAERGASKGLRGHVGALRHGEITTGMVKIVGIGATGLAAGALSLPSRDAGPTARWWLDVAGSGALVAGAANLVNLFDLRPGRALKVVLAGALLAARPGPAALLSAATAGAAVTLLPQDLSERSMLGDCGANALGAVLGTAAVAGRARGGRLGALVAVTALTLASEKVSFTKVIESTPGLRDLDALGRRPR